MASLPVSLQYNQLGLHCQVQSQSSRQLACQLSCSESLQPHRHRALRALATRCSTNEEGPPRPRASSTWLRNANANANAAQRLGLPAQHPSVASPSRTTPPLPTSANRKPHLQNHSQNTSLTPPRTSSQAPPGCEEALAGDSPRRYTASAPQGTLQERCTGAPTQSPLLCNFTLLPPPPLPPAAAAPPPPASLPRRGLLLSAALLASLSLPLPLPPPLSPLSRLSPLAAGPALAENVRLEDVESRELQLALEAAIAGDFESAEALFGKLIEQNRDSASMWSNRGSVRLSRGRYEDAVADFSEAIELAPFAAVPYLNRAIAYEALGRYEEAVRDCESAIRNDTHESAAWFNLGNIQTKLANHKKALEAYEIAADLSPGIAGYRLREANSLFQVGFASDAEKLIRSIVRKYPNYAEAHAALAGVLWGEGRLGPAEEQLSEAIEFEPNFRNFSWVADHVEWPPKLFQAYGDFLSLK